MVTPRPSQVGLSCAAQAPELLKLAWHAVSQRAVQGRLDSYPPQESCNCKLQSITCMKASAPVSAFGIAPAKMLAAAPLLAGSPGSLVPSQPIAAAAKHRTALAPLRKEQQRPSLGSESCRREVCLLRCSDATLLCRRHCKVGSSDDGRTTPPPNSIARHRTCGLRMQVSEHVALTLAGCDVTVHVQGESDLQRVPGYLEAQLTVFSMCSEFAAKQCTISRPVRHIQAHDSAYPHCRQALTAQCCVNWTFWFAFVVCAL
jgi:hypothetical protein